MNSERKIEILNKAKDVLFERGWYQGNWRNVEGNVCLLGAVAIANGSELLLKSDGGIINSAAVPQELYNELQDRCEYRAPARWNDENGRTFDQVIDKIDETIISIKDRQD